MCKLSVVVPIYNVETYIGRCATSLFEQTLSDIEFIFIDDKGRDRSMCVLDEICKKFPQLNSHIKIIKHVQNRGLAATRITGIQNARGEYIAFCDSDDWVDIDMYRQMYLCASNSNSDLIYSNYYVEYSKKTIQSDLKLVSDIDDYCISMLYGEIPSFVWNRLYKTHILKTYLSELYIEGIDMWEDMLMNIRLLPYIHSITFLPFSGYHYNQSNVHAITAVWSEKSKANIKKVVRLVTSFWEREEKMRFPLECFFLNAYYSIISHSSCQEIAKMERLNQIVSIAHLWKHPNMSFVNKCCLSLLYYDMSFMAWGIMKIKYHIRRLLLS